jgi:hypothetical protein
MQDEMKNERNISSRKENERNNDMDYYWMLLFISDLRHITIQTLIPQIWILCIWHCSYSIVNWVLSQPSDRDSAAQI